MLKVMSALIHGEQRQALQHDGDPLEAVDFDSIFIANGQGIVD